jgi:AraC-like DNA-binding protein
MQLRLLDSTLVEPERPRAVLEHVRYDTDERSTGQVADRMHFWRPLPWKVMDVVCGEGTALAAAPFHAHEAMQVLLPTSRFAAIGGQCTAALSPGFIHVTSPLDLCSARSLDDAPFRTRIMLIGPSMLAKMGSAPVPGAIPSISGLVVKDNGLHAELTALFEQLQRPLVDLECTSRLLACLRRLVAQLPDRPRAGSEAHRRQPAGVLRVRDHLREHAVSNLTLEELAAVAGLSKFYLVRAFHHAFGLTPHSYQMQLRLARARRLIAEGRPLSHVTYDAGFADQSHLTRRFAAFYGLTPARFARQVATPLSPAPDRRATAGWAVTSPSAA